MINKLLAVIAVLGLILVFLPFIRNFESQTELNPLAASYVVGSLNDLNSPNVVTSIVVTYRGLDTLGEVTVLFLATLAVGFLLQKETLVLEKDRYQKTSKQLHHF